MKLKKKKKNFRGVVSPVCSLAPQKKQNIVNNTLIFLKIYNFTL